MEGTPFRHASIVPASNMTVVIDFEILIEK